MITREASRNLTAGSERTHEAVFDDTGDGDWLSEAREVSLDRLTLGVGR